MISSSNYIKYLDCKAYLKDHLNVFIEAFVKYYGEERREEIEKKFNSIILIPYQNLSNKKLLLSTARKEKSKELIEEILKSNNTSLEYNDLFDTVDSFEYKEMTPIDKYSLFLNCYNYKKYKSREELIEYHYYLAKKIIPELTKEEYMEMITKKETLPKFDYLSNIKMRQLILILDIDNINIIYERTKEKSLALLQKIDPNITLDNLDDYMEKDERIIALNDLVNKYIQTLEEYEIFNKDLKQYDDRVKEEEQRKQAIKSNLYRELIIENIDFIPESKKDGLEEFLHDSSKYYKLSSEIRKIIGYSVEALGLIDAFSEESEFVLNNPKSPEWKTNSIKRDRIEFFNLLGINLGTNYDDYCNNDEVKKIWPSKERMKRYDEFKKRILNDYNNDLFTKSDFYIKTRQEIDERGFLDKEDPFDARLYLDSNNTFLSHNIKRNGEYYEFDGFIVINMDYYDDKYRDHSIVHELNHLLESFLVSANENFYTIICGWDMIDSPVAVTREEKIDTSKLVFEKRKYELFNEIINEMISQEISKIMKENGMGVFDDTKEAKYKGGTSYEHTRYLVKDFFEEFKDEILKSRKDGNINIILDTVGRENFEELNKLFEIFNENYSGNRLYAIINNRITDASRVYFELMERKNEILEKMREKRQERVSKMAL